MAYIGRTTLPLKQVTHQLQALGITLGRSLNHLKQCKHFEINVNLFKIKFLINTMADILLYALGIKIK